MTIALIAHDSKKELMVQFCTAYCRILSQHKLVATGTTGKLIAEATGLQVQRFLAGVQGGDQQFAAYEIHAVERRTVQREVREIAPFDTDVAQLCAVQPAVGEGHVAEEAVVPESVLGGERADRTAFHASVRPVVRLLRQDAGVDWEHGFEPERGGAGGRFFLRGFHRITIRFRGCRARAGRRWRG